MDVGLLSVLMCFIGAGLLAFLGVLLFVSIRRLFVRLTNTINGHTVEICTGYSYARLSIDGKVVDEMNSFALYCAKLVGNVDGTDILVNVGNSGFGRKITTFVGGSKDIQLSN